MKKETDVILYPAGAYGNFINWCHSYFSNKLESINIPMTESGSVHFNFVDSNRFILSSLQTQDYVSSDNTYPIIQMHETCITKGSKENISSDDWFDFFINDLEYLSSTFKSILYIYPSASSTAWLLNNYFYKTQPFKDAHQVDVQDLEKLLKDLHWSDYEINLFRHTGVDRAKLMLDFELSEDNFNQWGHTSSAEFELWELRELCSQYFYLRSHRKLLTEKQVTDLSARYKNIKFVKLDDLRDHFSDTILSILHFFGLTATDFDITNIYNQWLPKQHHINKDKLINDIVECAINNKDFEYSTLTFFDEFFIQRKLLDRGYEIACYNLNVFPSNTIDLHKLLIKQ